MDFAFTAVPTESGNKYTLGVAHRNQKGFSRVSGFEFETYDGAQARADGFNADIGLAKLEAWKIVASTMR